LSTKQATSIADILAAPDPESLGKVEDVARLLNVSRSWVHAHKHELPCLRIGGLLRFDLAQVRAWSRRQLAVDGASTGSGVSAAQE
jgi:excisionase family DNA binding protein